MSTLPKIKRITQTGIACPSQWDGEFADGRPLCMRYERGYLSARFGQDGEEFFGLAWGDQYDGNMSLRDMLRLTGLCIGDFADDRAPAAEDAS